MLKAKITWLTDSPEDNTFMKATTETGMEISWSKSLADVPLRNRFFLGLLVYLFSVNEIGKTL